MEQKLSTEIEETPEDILKVIRDTHVATVAHGLESLDQTKLQKAADNIVDCIIRERKIFTIGNGASAAIAQHWACDYTKGCSTVTSETSPRPSVRPEVISLATNIPLITAIANDISFNRIFSFQLERVSHPGDLLIAVSSSGNSPNIIEALKVAKLLNMFTISLTGFTGGYCEQLADINLTVDVQEYEATEDCHQAIMHMIAKYIRAKLH